MRIACAYFGFLPIGAASIVHWSHEERRTPEPSTPHRIVACHRCAACDVGRRYPLYSIIHLTTPSPHCHGRHMTNRARLALAAITVIAAFHPTPSSSAEPAPAPTTSRPVSRVPASPGVAGGPTLSAADIHTFPLKLDPRAKPNPRPGGGSGEIGGRERAELAR